VRVQPVLAGGGVPLGGGGVQPPVMAMSALQRHWHISMTTLSGRGDSGTEAELVVRGEGGGFTVEPPVMAMSALQRHWHISMTTLSGTGDSGTEAKLVVRGEGGESRWSLQ
jgi:hypothetical protein